MSYQIRSTYEEWAPEYDEFPNGRVWSVSPHSPPTHFMLYLEAWLAVEHYLRTAQRWRRSSENEEWLIPYGHTEPAAHYGETTIVNDAETITIFEA